MSLVIPNTLGARTTSIQLSTLDENFEYFRDQLNPYVNAITVGASNALTLNGTLTTTNNISAAAITATSINATTLSLSGGLTVTGDLTVNGTTTTVSTTNTVVKDALIELNNGATANTNDIGLIFQRGSTGANAAFVWDETNDRFSLGTTTATGASTGALTLTKATLSADLLGNVTGNVTGNAGTVTNGVYTTNFTGTTNQSTSVDGYQKLPGGLIMQWGTVPVTQSGSGTAVIDTNFPIPFPTACLSFQATTTGAASIDGELVVSFNQTQFGIKNRNATISACWFAIGY